MQRNVSTPLELHELNIVNKSNNDLSMSKIMSGSSKNRTNASNAAPTTPKKGQSFNIPMSGPRLNIKTTVISPKKNELNQSDSEFDEREKLYKLAQKKREISELEMKLVQLKKELKIMEQELKPILNKIHSEAVNTKNNRIKSKEQGGGNRADSNLDNSNQHSDDNDNDNYYGFAYNNDPDSSLINISQHIPSKFKENKFVKTLLNKFNEFNVNEDEFDDHVRSQNDSSFYLREGYNLGEDELEREAEEEIGFLQKFNKWQNKQINK